MSKAESQEELRIRVEKWYEAIPKPVYGERVISIIQGFVAKEKADSYRAGLLRAAEVAKEWANSKSCSIHSDNPCCHVRTGAGIANRIKSLASEIGAQDGN